MKKVSNISQQSKTRTELNDCFLGLPMSVRLKEGNVTDLNNNHVREKVGKNYSVIRSIDPNKKY
jgi:hypothetical protein